MADHSLATGAGVIDGNIGLAHDSGCHLLLPADDTESPEVTILVPAANEQLTIADFVAWCHEGLREAGAVGEILIVDSSSDRTAELALAGGARVLRTPRRGLGRAYIDALPYVRGKYVIMGDADCTYDFRQAGALHRRDARRHRVRDGLAVEGFDRAGGDARSASLRRHARHHLDPQPPLRQPLQRYPLRDAGHHPGRALPHGPDGPVVGVRLRDGAEVGPHGAADHGGAGHLLQGP